MLQGSQGEGTKRGGGSEACGYRVIIRNWAQAVLTSTSWGSGRSSRPWETKQEERGRDRDFSEAHPQTRDPRAPRLITGLWGTGLSLLWSSDF